MLCSTFQTCEEVGRRGFSPIWLTIGGASFQLKLRNDLILPTENREHSDNTARNVFVYIQFYIVIDLFIFLIFYLSYCTEKSSQIKTM